MTSSPIGSGVPPTQSQSKPKSPGLLKYAERTQEQEKLNKQFSPPHIQKTEVAILPQISFNNISQEIKTNNIASIA